MEGVPDFGVQQWADNKLASLRLSSVVATGLLISLWLANWANDYGMAASTLYGIATSVYLILKMVSKGQEVLREITRTSRTART